MVFFNFRFLSIGVFGGPEKAMGHPHCDYMRPIQRLSSGSRDFWVQATKTLEIARFQENHGVSKLSKLRLCCILYEMSKLLIRLWGPTPTFCIWLSHRWTQMLARHFQVQGYRQPPAVQQKKHVRTVRSRRLGWPRHLQKSQERKMKFIYVQSQRGTKSVKKTTEKNRKL